MSHSIHLPVTVSSTEATAFPNLGDEGLPGTEVSTIYQLPLPTDSVGMHRRQSDA